MPQIVISLNSSSGIERNATQYRRQQQLPPPGQIGYVVVITVADRDLNTRCAARRGRIGKIGSDAGRKRFNRCAVAKIQLDKQHYISAVCNISGQTSDDVGICRTPSGTGYKIGSGWKREFSDDIRGSLRSRIGHGERIGDDVA